jgi:asparagine synthase (glutamine-hydrolysing)
MAGLMKWRNRGEALLRKIVGRAHATAESLAASAPYGPGYPGSAEAEVVQGAGLASQGGQAFARWQDLRQVYRDLAGPVEAETLAFMLEDLHGHLGTILHRTDRVLMGLGIEGRVPFLENEIMDFALNLPLAQKIGNKGGKRILKKVAEGFLPREIVYRRKVGFPVPWQGYLPATVPQVLQDGFVCEWMGWKTATLEAAYHLSPTSAFRLLAVEVFGRIFARGANPDSLEIL